jgi:hypothetical protein
VGPPSAVTPPATPRLHLPNLRNAALGRRGGRWWRPRRGFRAELGKDVGHVGAGGLHTDEQGRGDLGVGVALGDEPENLPLPAGKPVRVAGSRAGGVVAVGFARGGPAVPGRRAPRSPLARGPPGVAGRSGGRGGAQWWSPCASLIWRAGPRPRASGRRRPGGIPGGIASARRPPASGEAGQLLCAWVGRTVAALTITLNVSRAALVRRRHVGLAGGSGTG